MKMQGMAGNNNSDLTEMNRSVVVQILQRREVCSRADIARETGLTQAAITKIVAALMEMGIISEVGNIRGNSNRRSIGLQLNADKHKVIGVKFARYMFSVGVFDISGKVYFQTEKEYPIEQDQKTVLAKMKEQIREVLEMYRDVAAIGLAVPGPYLRKEGRIAVITQMLAWRSINFIEEFKNAFDRPVFIEHDANAGAMASWWFGDHDDTVKSIAYFLLGDGVGAGIIERGKLLLGQQGVAGEIGHISINVHGARCECGNYGCLEQYCSVNTLLKLARQRAPECFPDTPMRNRDACDALFEAARGGNQNALDAVREIAEYIGYGCVMIINAYNPDMIVIGDMMARGGDLILPVVQEVVRQRTISELQSRVQIKISGLTVDPTLYGAAAAATDKILQMPSVFLTPKEGTPE